MKKELIIITVITIVILLFVVFRDNLNLAPKYNGENKKPVMDELTGKSLKNPSTKEAKSLFNMFFTDGNG